MSDWPGSRNACYFPLTCVWGDIARGRARIHARRLDSSSVETNSENVFCSIYSSSEFLGRGEGWSDQREQALTCPRETCKVVWCNERFVLTGNTCNFWSGQEKKIKYIKISATKRHQKPLIIHRIYLPKQCKCPR